MKRVLIKTLGCKVNQCESETIQRTLERADRQIVSGAKENADVVLVNTCAVTGKAAMQSRQAVRQAIRNHPGARVVVTGCHAQASPEAFSAIEGVDLIVGNRDKHLIPAQILATWKSDCNDGDAVSKPRNLIKAATRRSRPAERKRASSEMPAEVAAVCRTRPFLKIQDGCNAFCTYCIVPYTRGRSRSLPVEQVLRQIARLARAGYKEVVLTGIHLGCYGLDLTPTTRLYDLLCRIREAGQIDRIRLSSIEPTELSDQIVRLCADHGVTSGRLCPHFHVPLQSGDNAILKRMNRPYTREAFGDLVRNIIDQLPDAAVGVDTLIGFPGESPVAFDHTFDLIASLPVAYLHVFPFSAREGTPAFAFGDRVPSLETKRRCERMRQLGHKKRLGFYTRYRGKTVVVLVEETRRKSDGRLKGLTDNYVPVVFDGPDDCINQFQPIAIRDLTADGVPQGAICT